MLQPDHFDTYLCKGGDMFDSIAIVFNGGEELIYPVYLEDEVEEVPASSAPWYSSES